MPVDRKTLLIVFHSASGTTEAMTNAVVDGIQTAGDESLRYIVKNALQVTADDVKNADGVILATPENFGYMSGALKYFFDTIYYECLEHTQGTPYALVIRGGNDGEGAVQSIRRIVTGLAWQEIAPPVLSKGEFDRAILQDCHELGATFAVGLEAGIF